MTRTRHAMRLLPIFLLLSSSGASLAETGKARPSPYAGQDARSIKSLSAKDIAELRRGGGWGLAKAAELNGIPGPAHLLELRNDIPLTADQISAVTGIFDRMRAEAIAAGKRLIAGERKLEQAFRSRTLTDESLRIMLADITRARSALRYVHLSAHLKTYPLLMGNQIARYNALRGYGANPCANVPKGHDPKLWRKHNSCN